MTNLNRRHVLAATIGVLGSVASPIGSARAATAKITSTATSNSIVRPARLRAGDAVALVAPASVSGCKILFNKTLYRHLSALPCLTSLYEFPGLQWVLTNVQNLHRPLIFQAPEDVFPRLFLARQGAVQQKALPLTMRKIKNPTNNNRNRALICRLTLNYKNNSSVRTDRAFQQNH